MFSYCVADLVERVALGDRVRFAELEAAEKRLGCRFPRTGLQQPQLNGEGTTAAALQ